jgi:hypothetical protein
MVDGHGRASHSLYVWENERERKEKTWNTTIPLESKQGMT